MADFNYVDGKLVEIEPVDVTDDGALVGLNGPYRVIGAAVHLTGTHNGSVHLEDGASLTLVGVLNGSLQVAGGCTAAISTRHNGSLHIAAGGAVRVAGSRAARFTSRRKASSGSSAEVDMAARFTMTAVTNSPESAAAACKVTAITSRSRGRVSASRRGTAGTRRSTSGESSGPGVLSLPTRSTAAIAGAP